MCIKRSVDHELSDNYTCTAAFFVYYCNKEIVDVRDTKPVQDVF